MRHRSADCSAARRLSPGYAVHAEPSGHGASTEHPRNPRAREDGRFASTACALCPAHGHGDAGDGAFAGPGRARTGPAARPRRKRDTYSVQPKAKQRERGGGTGAQDRQLRAAGSAAGQGSQQLALPAAEGQDPQQLALPAPQAEAAAVEEDTQRKFPTAQETGAPQQEGGPKGSAAQQMREALAEHLRNREGKDKAPHPQKRPSAKAATRKKPAASGQETRKKPAASGVSLRTQQAKRGYTTMWYGSTHKCAIRQTGGRQLCQFGQKRYTRQKLEAHAWHVIGQIEAGKIREADAKEACEGFFS